MTLAVVVPEAARRYGDRPAFVMDHGPDEPGTPLSYAELDRRSDAAAAGLAARGIGEGDLVLLTTPSNLGYLITYAAAAKVGAVTAGVNPRFTDAERDAVLEVAQADLVVDDATAAELEASGERLGAPPPRLADPADPERLVAVVFTSGTTGRPKGAMFGNREIAAIARFDGVTGWPPPDDPGGAQYAATQFSHIGIMTKLAWYLQKGMTTYLLPRWRAADVLRLLSTHHMAAIGGIAPQVALLLRQPDFDDYDLSSVQAIIMGGALSPPALVAEARRRFGAAYSIRYSSTESGGVGTGTAFDADDDEALYTVGRPRGDVEIELRDALDQPVPTGEVGEIVLRSSAMMRGYWRDPAATAEAIRDGWYHSGDLGRLDERGLLHMAGRAKEMYIRGGYNVYPAEVEAALASHPAVRQVAMVPRPDDVMGEIGVAIVVPVDPDQAPTLEDLRAHGAQRLASYKLPEAIRIVDELPLTAMQKVDRRALTGLAAVQRQD